MAPDEGARVSRDHDGDDRESRGEDNREKPKGPSDSEQKRTFFSNRYFQAGVAVLALGAVGAGVVWWLDARKYENTDDAFVDAHIVRLSPQVAGKVTQIHVTDNQLVHKGDPLLDIDAADFDAKLVQAKAQQVQAETQLLQNEASEKGAEAQAENAQRDLERYRLLLMAIVPLQFWVTANFKETQLALMRRASRDRQGRRLRRHAEVDGHVDSIQRGAGQAFGILPPENATGNYVKVVQRVPVKIVLDNMPEDCPLGRA
jgi:multidrug resistance efflux pump